MLAPTRRPAPSTRSAPRSSWRTTVAGSIVSPSARADELGVEAEGYDVLFAPGFTTSALGELSGRGVGLSAVRDDLAQVGYAISVESAPGEFTRFTVAPRI